MHADGEIVLSLRSRKIKTAAGLFVCFLSVFFFFPQKRAKYFMFTGDRDLFARVHVQRIKIFGTSVISKSRIYVFEFRSLSLSLSLFR